MYVNATQAAIDAAENSYEKLVRFSEFDANITAEDVVETKIEKDMLIIHFKTMMYESYFMNERGNLCVKFKDYDFEIREIIENKEAISMAVNACDAYECAYRLNQLAFR